MVQPKNRRLATEAYADIAKPDPVNAISDLPQANADNQGLIRFVTAENEPYYSNGTTWSSVSQGAQGVPGPAGAGVPSGGEPLQIIRKNSVGTTTEWATLTKSLVGLSNVDNTSDMNKPVSTMQKLALDEKLDAAALSDEVDPLNASLIENPNSLTNTALSAAIVDGSKDALDPRGRNPVSGVFYARRYGFDAANTAAANTAALSLAMGGMSRGDTLVLPQGIFKVDPITVPKNMRIRGTNAPGFHVQYPYGDARWLLAGAASGTVLQFPNTTGDAITIPGTATSNGTALQDLALIGPGSGTSTGLFAGLRGAVPGGAASGWPLRVRLDNVGIANFSTAFHSNCENSTFNGLYIVGCDIGLSTFWPFNGNAFTGLNVEVCNTHALKIVDSDTNIFTGGVVQGCPAEKVLYMAGASNSNIFLGVYFENGHNTTAPTTNDIWIEGGVKNEFRRVRFGSQLAVNPAIHLGAGARLNTFYMTNGAYKLTIEGSRNAIYGYVLGTVTDTGKGNIVQSVGAEHHTILPITNIAASYVVSTSLGDRLIVAEVGAVINLPSANSGAISKGMVVTVKAKEGACTLASGGVLIDASTTGVVVPAWGKVSVIFDGTQWLTI